MRCDYEQTRKAWFLVKQMYTASSDAHMDSKEPEYKKAYRTVGKSLSFIYTTILVLFVPSCTLVSENMRQKYFLDVLSIPPILKFD